MASLSNYLRTNRRRLALSQEEVGFLVGIKGEGKGIKVCRDEKLAREPDLRTVLAYEAIYGRPIREIFAGLYEQVEKEVAERAKVQEAVRQGGRYGKEAKNQSGADFCYRIALRTARR